MAVPEVTRSVQRDGETVWYIKCPGCAQEGAIDVDQFAGRVSIDCTNCDYHETHDLRERGTYT